MQFSRTPDSYSLARGFRHGVDGTRVPGSIQGQDAASIGLDEQSTSLTERQHVEGGRWKGSAKTTGLVRRKSEIKRGARFSAPSSETTSSLLVPEQL